MDKGKLDGEVRYQDLYAWNVSENHLASNT